MLMQPIFVVTCPVCGESIPLPRRSLLGMFEPPHCQPTDIWPINYLCHECGQFSFHLAESIQPKGVEVQGQDLVNGKLICHEFGTGNGAEKTRIFSWLSQSSWSGEDFEKLIRHAGLMSGDARLVRSFAVDIL
jgi:hypothetical protein